jgi:formamidopyrimidine-DNA glycosylase
VLPELPEVETICRGLKAALTGDVIQAAEVLRSDSIGYPTVDEFCRQISGHRFENVYRRGKYILIDLDEDSGFAVHLRMSGRMLVVEPLQTSNKFLRVRFLLKSGRELHFEDMRVFGRIWYVPAGCTFEQIIPALADLGIEPLTEFDGAALARIFKNRKQAVKTALLDQRLIAGIGNIYADESLFQANIHPLRPAHTLRTKELQRLATEIISVLRCAIELGGTTIRDYTSSQGINGKYQNEAWVYGRTGESCKVCARRIVRTRIAGRSAHYCPKCQKEPRF